MDDSRKIDGLAPFARRFFEQAAPQDLPVLANSEHVDQPIDAFWEERHAEDSRTWLTGSHGEEVWKRLGVRDRLGPAVRVLNIGVGMGYCTRELAALGTQTHAVDIAPSALARVVDVATTWNAANLNWLPESYFDVALSHLVAQHMNDDALVGQIREVSRALRPEGVFAMQFAHPCDGEGQLDTRLNAKAGAVLRTHDKMSDLASAAGAIITSMEITEQYAAYGMGWSTVHFRKA